MPEGATVLLGGMPRAGTTLLCAMLNEQPGCVALAEPMRPGRHGDGARALADIAAFARGTRRDLLAGRPVVSTGGGAAVDNFVPMAPAGSALRVVEAPLAAWSDASPNAGSLRLFIKQPGLVAALAGALSADYPVYLVLRHPLAVLASWQTVPMAVRAGHMPVAESLRPDLAARLARAGDALGRQVVLLAWLLEAALAHPRGQVLLYEEFVAEPAYWLAPLAGGRWQAGAQRRPHDRLCRYAGQDLARLAHALWPLVGLAQPFWPGFAGDLAEVIAAG